MTFQFNPFTPGKKQLALFLPKFYHITRYTGNRFSWISKPQLFAYLFWFLRYTGSAHILILNFLIFTVLKMCFLRNLNVFEFF